MTKAQRQQYLEAKGLLHQAGPLAILRLVRLAGIDLETNTLIPDDRLPDPRVVLIAAQNLAERVYGRPKEMERPVAAETEPAEQPTNTHVTVRFVEASKTQSLEPPIIDATPAAENSEGRRSRNEQELEVTPTGALRKVVPSTTGSPLGQVRELRPQRPVQNASGFSGRR